MSNSDSFQGKRVLVTGSTGFLGSHLVRKLIELEAEVVCLIRTSSARERISDCLERMEVIDADLHHREEVFQAVKRTRPRIVFHLATYGVDPRQTDPSTTLQTNLLGLANLIEALTQTPCERFVNTGSCFEYGGQNGDLLTEESPLSPLNLYAASKTMAWHLCRFQHRQNGFPVVTLRPFTFFGPQERPDRLIPSTIRSILQGEEIRITAGTQTRDYTYMEDVVDAYLRAAVSQEAVGQTFNIGSGTESSVLKIVEQIRELMGSRVPIRAGVLETRSQEAWRLCCDAAKAGRVLGWFPRVSFEEGLSRTIRWMTNESYLLR